MNKFEYKEIEQILISQNNFYIINIARELSFNVSEQNLSNYKPSYLTRSILEVMNYENIFSKLEIILEQYKDKLVFAVFT